MIELDKEDLDKEDLLSKVQELEEELYGVKAELSSAENCIEELQEEQASSHILEFHSSDHTLGHDIFINHTLLGKFKLRATEDGLEFRSLGMDITVTVKDEVSGNAIHHHHVTKFYLSDRQPRRVKKPYGYCDMCNRPVFERYEDDYGVYHFVCSTCDHDSSIILTQPKECTDDLSALDGSGEKERDQGGVLPVPEKDS